MAKQSKSKNGRVLGIIGSILLVLFFVVGAICFFVLDSAGGVAVSYTYTTAVTGSTYGLIFYFVGLAAVFGGDCGMMSSELNGDAVDLGVKQAVNANVGVIIGLCLILIGVILLVAFRKNKICASLGFVFSLAATV